MLMENPYIWHCRSRVESLSKPAQLVRERSTNLDHAMTPLLEEDRKISVHKRQPYTEIVQHRQTIIQGSFFAHPLQRCIRISAP